MGSVHTSAGADARLSQERADAAQPASLRTISAISEDERVYSVGKLAALVHTLYREGIPPSKALRGVDLAEDALHRSSTRVSAGQLIRICRNALALSHDPHLPFHAGMGVHLSTYGIYGFAILSSSNFRKAIAFALRYHQLAFPLVDLSWREERGRDTWTLLPIPTLHLDTRLLHFVIEFELAIVLSLHRDMMGKALVPLEVHQPFNTPLDARVYADMFGCPVVFGQTHARIIFDSRRLEGELLFGNEIAHSELVNLCDELLREMRLRIGIAGRVREILLVNRMTRMGVAEVAKELHMTERTLRRKLSQENTSFRKILTELRMRLASQYLRDTDLTVGEIANSLGFTEDASFRHAFRRWSKLAPGGFRARLQGRLRR